MCTTFRPRSNFAWAAMSVAFAVLFAVNSILVAESTVQIALELTLCAILISLAYLLWLRPKLVLRDETIEVVNPLRTEVISYADIRELETKWALTITHRSGITRVWAAPASGKRRWIAETTFGWYATGVPLSKSRAPEAETMSASLNSLSGQAAYLIREQMKRRH